MSIKELNASQVKNELEILIQKYPDRRGSVPMSTDYDGDDYTCVYYLDEFGLPINTSNYDEDDSPTLKTPVCIVGTWIEEFHPEFKQDEIVRSFLVRNATIGSLYETSPFSDDVREILSIAQNAQDAHDAVWKDIEL